jgi:hypothetical protein
MAEHKHLSRLLQVEDKAQDGQMKLKQAVINK